MQIKSKVRDYNVSFYDNVESLTNSMPGQQVLWVVDSNVLKHWRFPQERIVFISDEQSKSFASLPGLIDCFLSMRVKRSTTVIAIGGGTLQDAVGFVCSIFNRGINWIFVPTTLLAQADSCIGGKTSCNYNNKKNILGTFYPPNEVKICKDFLSTLNQEQYNSGMGEVVKFYVLNNELSQMSADVGENVRYSLTYKKQVIEEDEFDKGKRVFLNFGHTFGHALESTSDYKIPHGIAVLIGMLIADRYAVNIGVLSHEKEQEIEAVIKPLVGCELNEDWFDFDKLMVAVKADKKNTNDIRMVLLSDLDGWNPFLHNVHDFAILKQSIKELRQ